MFLLMEDVGYCLIKVVIVEIWGDWQFLKIRLTKFATLIVSSYQEGFLCSMYDAV